MASTTNPQQGTNCVPATNAEWRDTLLVDAWPHVNKTAACQQNSLAGEQAVLGALSLAPEDTSMRSQATVL